MNCSFKHKHQIHLFVITVFLLMLMFFWKLYPIVAVDADDINYLTNIRPAIPIPGFWNPIRVLPEVLMPICGNLAGVLSSLGLGSFFDCQVFTIALALSFFISLYTYTFCLFMRKCLNSSIDRSICYSIIFLLFHFLVFRTEKAANLYLFHAYDACCYFFYTIGHLLNLSLLFYFMAYEGKDKIISREKPLKSSLVILGIYFAVFSNLYCSISLAAFAGWKLLSALFNAVKKKEKFSAVIAENFLYALILILWFISLLIEYSGGRANSLSNTDFSFWGRFARCLSFIAAAFGHTNILFRILLAAVLLAALIILPFSKNKKQFLKLFGILLLTEFTIILFLLLLSSIVYPDYMGRTEVLFPCMSLIFVIIIISIEFIIKKIDFIQLFLPLFIVFALTILNTGQRCFADSNAFGSNSLLALEIQNDVESQIKFAVQNGQQKMDLYLINTGDYYANWPHNLSTGDELVRFFFKYGLIDREIKVNPVPSDAFNHKYAIESHIWREN